MGESIYSNRTDFNWPLTGRNRTERERKISGLVIIVCGPRLRWVRGAKVK